MENKKYVVVNRDSENKLQKLSFSNKKDADMSCMYLEVLHGLGKYVVMSEEDFELVNQGKLKSPI